MAARSAVSRLLLRRGYAESALARESDFLRWTTPVPQAFNHAGILAQAPTKARRRRRRRRERLLPPPGAPRPFSNCCLTAADATSPRPPDRR